MNNTIRLYKGYYFWELKGLANTTRYVEGPFTIWYKNMAPVLINTSIVTYHYGYNAGHTFKYKSTQWWAWDTAGNQEHGGREGLYWSGLPKTGFTTAYQDANASGLGFPMFIGFYDNRVYYYNSLNVIYTVVGHKDGYIGGQFGENFPANITSVFSWPSSHKNVEYYVYLFRGREHCFRPWKAKASDQCEWKSNKELFGCLNTGNTVLQPTKGSPPTTEESPYVELNSTEFSNTVQSSLEPNPSTTTEEELKASLTVRLQQNAALLLAAISYLIFS